MKNIQEYSNFLKESIEWNDLWRYYYITSNKEGDYFQLGDNPSLVARDLSGENLSFLVFDGEDMKSVDLRDCDLSFASFKGCDMSGAKFHGAEIAQADFSMANLEGATGLEYCEGFEKANIEKAINIPHGLLERMKKIEHGREMFGL